MRDEEEILGTWTVTFRQWRWEYKFAYNKTVHWRDPFNNESGSGRWYKVGNLINISWTDSTTKESWRCPINPGTQSGWIDASYGVGTFEANRTKSGIDYTVPRASQIPILYQGDSTICWAVGVAMMIGWRRHNPDMTVDQAMDIMGDPFITLYRERQPLNKKNYEAMVMSVNASAPWREDFTRKARLTSEPLRCYTPTQLYEVMSRYGSPLLVESAWGGSWTHMLVVKTIRVNYETKKATIVYHDPLSGPSRTKDPDDPDDRDDQKAISFDEFMKRMEGIFQGDSTTTMQVWHY
jgi:hypothetical protein